METHITLEQAGRRGIVAALIIAAFLAGALFASVANSPAQIRPTAPAAHAPGAAPTTNFVPSDAGDVGRFAFGHIEFDWNPKAPSGVPGFDSWPPGSPPQP